MRIVLQYTDRSFDRIKTRPTALQNFAARPERVFESSAIFLLFLRRHFASLESIGAFWGRIPPRLELSTLDYASEHTEISVLEIRCAEVVRLPPHPFRTHTSFGELKAAPAFVFEIPNVNFWAHYGGAVVT